MVVRIGMAPRLAGMSILEFQAHWRSDHADAVKFLPGLQRYVQNHAVLAEDGWPLLLAAPFDACSEIEFLALADMEAAFGSAAFLEVVKQDEGNFVDTSRLNLFFAERSTLTDGPEFDGTKLLTLGRRHPSVDGATAADTMREVGQVIASHPQARRQEVLVGIDTGYTDRWANSYDVGHAVWFDDLEAAQAVLRSDEYHDGLRRLAGHLTGVDRVLCLPQLAYP